MLRSHADHNKQGFILVPLGNDGTDLVVCWCAHSRLSVPCCVLWYAPRMGSIRKAGDVREDYPLSKRLWYMCCLKKCEESVSRLWRLDVSMQYVHQSAIRLERPFTSGCSATVGRASPLSLKLWCFSLERRPFSNGPLPADAKTLLGLSAFPATLGGDPTYSALCFCFEGGSAAPKHEHKDCMHVISPPLITLIHPIRLLRQVPPPVN